MKWILVEEFNQEIIRNDIFNTEADARFFLVARAKEAKQYNSEVDVKIYENYAIILDGCGNVHTWSIKKA